MRKVRKVRIWTINFSKFSQFSEQIFKSDAIRRIEHIKKWFGAVDTIGTVERSVPRMPRVSCKFLRKKLNREDRCKSGKQI